MSDAQALIIIGLVLLALAIVAAVCGDEDPDVRTTRAYSEAIDAVRRAGR
jgi:hypothetical protein